MRNKVINFENSTINFEKSAKKLAQMGFILNAQREENRIIFEVSKPESDFNEISIERLGEKAGEMGEMDGWRFKVNERGYTVLTAIVEGKDESELLKNATERIKAAKNGKNAYFQIYHWEVEGVKRYMARAMEREAEKRFIENILGK